MHVLYHCSMHGGSAVGIHNSMLATPVVEWGLFLEIPLPQIICIIIIPLDISLANICAQAISFVSIMAFYGILFP